VPININKPKKGEILLMFAKYKIQYGRTIKELSNLYYINISLKKFIDLYDCKLNKPELERFDKPKVVFRLYSNEVEFTLSHNEVLVEKYLSKAVSAKGLYFGEIKNKGVI